MRMLKNILPDEAFCALDFVGRGLQEIRLRSDKPITVLYMGKKYFLSKDGLTLKRDKAITITSAQMSDAFLNACQHSVHSFSEQLSKGFLAPDGGIRIGVCGTAVTEGDKVVSFKDITSFNIRIPSEVKNCSAKAAEYLIYPPHNVLIVSRPGAGKTTFLRDLIFQTSRVGNPPNVLVADERNEICGCGDGAPQFDLGDFCDCVCMADKIFAFSCGIRTMTPDILACDEISVQDISSLENISAAGVRLFCTAHGEGPKDLEKFGVKTLEKIFDRYVFLTDRNMAGEVAGIYDQNMTRLDL